MTCIHTISLYGRNVSQLFLTDPSAVTTAVSVGILYGIATKRKHAETIRYEEKGELTLMIRSNEKTLVTRRKITHAHYCTGERHHTTE